MPATNDGPQAALMATPATGSVPLVVTLDATDSRAADAAVELVARFDFDGDGAWDTEFAPELRVEVTLEALGDYLPKVEVRDPEGRTASAEADTTVTVMGSGQPHADLTVDSNRDGALDRFDDLHEATWTEAFGAAALSNLDDDDDDGQRDAADERINGDLDRQDLMPVRLHRIEGLDGTHTVRLTVSPIAAAERVRLFDEAGALLKPTGDASVTVPNERVQDEDLVLYLEAAGTRSAAWDGAFTLELAVLADGAPITSDQASARVSPVVFPDDTREMHTLFVMRIDAQTGSNGGWVFGGGLLGGVQSPPDNVAFYDAVMANLPAQIELYTAAGADYGYDRWIQDNMQSGFQEAPVSDGSARMETYLQTARTDPQRAVQSLTQFVPGELLGAGTGFSAPGGEPTSQNYGGNLEVLPPHGDYPLGRLVVGGGDQGSLRGITYSARMAKEQREWLEAQAAQGPAIEVSTEWLAVGHVDEIFVVVPDRSGADGRGWKLILASPALAIDALRKLEDAGRGDAVVFQGRDAQTTVSRILGDSDLMQYNAAAQTRIDGVRMQLIDEVGLSDDDFVELPVMYEELHFGGAPSLFPWASSSRDPDVAAAYNPGMQNLIAAGEVLFVPDPEGPDGVWRDMAQKALEATGHEVVFVDVFDSYHVLLGEAHCGSNAERAGYDTHWWEVQP